MATMARMVGTRIKELSEMARAAEIIGDTEAAWRSLEDAHMLSQRWALPHVRVHWQMLRLARRTRDGGEVAGQVGRLLVAGPASVLGRYPAGNSGRAGVSAFAPAPIRPELASLLDGGDRPIGDGSGVLDPSGVRRLYDRVAPFYDIASKPYGWFGAGRIVDRAVEELRLQPGDTVVDLGTGTGRNLLVLAELVGPSGRVIGVDVSPEMLRRAQDKLDERGIHNVELVEADMASFDPPLDTAGVLATFSIEMLPNYDDVIRRLAERVRSGRIAVCGLRDPDRWPEWTIRVASALNRPFGVAEDYRSHRPWESIQAHTIDAIYEEAFAGAIYVAAGSTTNTTEN